MCTDRCIDISSLTCVSIIWTISIFSPYFKLQLYILCYLSEAKRKLMNFLWKFRVWHLNFQFQVSSSSSSSMCKERRQFLLHYDLYKLMKVLLGKVFLSTYLLGDLETWFKTNTLCRIRGSSLPRALQSRNGWHLSIWHNGAELLTSTYTKYGESWFQSSQARKVKCSVKKFTLLLYWYYLEAWALFSCWKLSFGFS